MECRDERSNFLRGQTVGDDTRCFQTGGKRRRTRRTRRTRRRRWPNKTLFEACLSFYRWAHTTPFAEDDENVMIFDVLDKYFEEEVDMTDLQLTLRHPKTFAGAYFFEPDLN